jgi:enoyl-CoA hydratase/carnithine racemase
MGKQHASALLLAADKLTAQEMYVSGLVTKVIAAPSQAEFLEVVVKQAKKIGTFNEESLRMTKSLVNQPSTMPELSAASAREGEGLRIRFASDDVQAAMKAFSDKSGKAKM